MKPFLVTGNDQGDQLMTTTEVENWPVDPLGIQGPNLMQHLLQHLQRFNTEVVSDHIHTAKLEEKPMRLPTAALRGFEMPVMVVEYRKAAMTREGQWGHRVNWVRSCNNALFDCKT